MWWHWSPMSICLVLQWHLRVKAAFSRCMATAHPWALKNRPCDSENQRPISWLCKHERRTAAYEYKVALCCATNVRTATDFPRNRWSMTTVRVSVMVHVCRSDRVLRNWKLKFVTAGFYSEKHLVRIWSSDRAQQCLHRSHPLLTMPLPRHRDCETNRKDRTSCNSKWCRTIQSADHFLVCNLFAYEATIWGFCVYI